MEYTYMHSGLGCYHGSPSLPDAASCMRDVSSTLRDASTTVRDLSTSVRGALPAAYQHYANAERGVVPVSREVSVPMPGEVRTPSDPGHLPGPARTVSEVLRSYSDSSEQDDKPTFHKPELAPTAYSMPKRTPTTSPVKVSLPVPDESPPTVPTRDTVPANSLIPAKSSFYPALSRNGTNMPQTSPYPGNGSVPNYNGMHNNSLHNNKNNYSNNNTPFPDSTNYGNNNGASRQGFARRFDESGRYGTLAIPELLQSGEVPMDGQLRNNYNSNKTDSQRNPYEPSYSKKMESRRYDPNKFDQARVWSNPAPIIVESRMVAGGGLWGKSDANSPQHYVSV